MTATALLRAAGPALLAVLAAWAFDRLTARRGLTPPGFAQPWRRGLALLAIAGVLWAGVFSPLGEIGKGAHVDFAHLGPWRLFLLHELMVGAILVWFFTGFAGVRRPRPPALETASELPGAPETPAAPAAPKPRRVPLGRQLALQLGLATPAPGREAGLGLLLGIGAWMAVIVAVAIVALTLYALGAKGALPKQPPELIPWLAGLPFVARLLLALSAGVVEESFFRGLLQPRMGIALSTGMFILAHTVYGQPFLLLGVGVLSIIYALLVRWRQNILPAIAAHALFDGVQLLVIIPTVLKMTGGHLPS